MRDVEVVETSTSKTETDYDLETDSLSVSTHKSKLITFRGIDWMFAKSHVNDLTDDELRPTLEYHRAFVHHLESEILERQVKRQRQVLGVRVQPRVKVTQTTTVTRKRVAKSIDMDALVDMAMKLGLTDLKDIQAFLAKQAITTDKVQ